VIAAIGEVLAQKEQAMIIVNRRGFAPFLLDTSKGEVLQCPHCSISLTFHSAKGIAQCHYCDYRESIARLIAKDERSRICAVGHGSQKVELLLQKLFPEAVIVRCDSDSVAGGKSLEGILANFREKKIDLLVGTQMLAKGHDFPNVTLVALLEIDAMLHLPDFRAGERTFQLMVQAAGRTGRADKPGRVLLQTLKADNRIVSAALHHDYLSFAEEELRFRRRFNYPPYSKIAVIELTSAHDLELAAFGAAISTWLTELSRTERELFHTLRILGPGVPAIAKVRQRYRRTMVVMAPGATQLHYFLGLYLSRFAKLPAGVRQNLDVDPQSLL
jgi:primosomal protein N' (replication factor Y)